MVCVGVCGGVGVGGVCVRVWYLVVPTVVRVVFSCEEHTESILER